MFSINIILAIIWTALTGSLSWGNLLLGMIFGYLILSLVARSSDEQDKKTYVHRVWKGLTLILFFLKEIIISNIRVTWEVITPGHGMTPGVIAVPLDIESELGITLLANMITMTPGTLSLDVSKDKKILYVHSMYIDNKDSEALKKKIKYDFERRIMEVME